MYEITLFSLVACILSICGYIPYIQSILVGKTKPSRTSWLIWTILSAILTYNCYLMGIGNAIFLMIVGFLGCFVITCLSFIYSSEREFIRSNYLYLAVAIVGSVSLIFLNSILISTIVCILINFIGLLPTVRNAYFNPSQENKLSWLLFFLANLTNVFEIKTWPFELLAYQSYMILSGFLVVFLLFRSISLNVSGMPLYFLTKLKKRL